MLPEGHLQSSVSLQVEAMYPRDTDIHYASSATKINATVWRNYNNDNNIHLTALFRD